MRNAALCRICRTFSNSHWEVFITLRMQFNIDVSVAAKRWYIDKFLQRRLGIHSTPQLLINHQICEIIAVRFGD